MSPYSEDIRVKFDRLSMALSKKCKITSNGVVKGLRDLLFTFWDPLHISKRLKLETCIIIVGYGTNWL